MTPPTDAEQMMLEWLNRARMDPAGIFARLVTQGDGITADIDIAMDYFGVDVSALKAQLGAFDPVAPLAWNAALARAALGHAALLIANDSQSHQEPGEPALGQRVKAAGYDFLAVLENVYSYAKSPFYAHAGFMIDWGFDAGDIMDGQVQDTFALTGDGMQDPAGHRLNIMNPLMRDVGIALLAEDDPATDVGPWVVTQNFGFAPGSEPYLLGVVMQDHNGNGVYDIGEGIGGATVTAVQGAQQAVTTTWATGGYQIALTPGTWDVHVTGAGFVSLPPATLSISSANVKFDAVVVPAVSIIGTDAAETLLGSAAGEVITGLAGADTLIGGAGADTLTAGAGADWVIPGAGEDVIDGGAGRDMVSYADLDGGVVVDLSAGTARHGTGADSLVFVERITGTSHADLFHGSDRAEDFRGLGGYDWFYGTDHGADRYYGGAGRDMISYAHSRVAVAASLQQGTGGTQAGAPDLYDGIERLTGSAFADALAGDDARNVLRGMYGADTLAGLGGNDRLYGGKGDDLLQGGDGWDVAIYDRAMADYVIDRAGDVLTVTARIGPEGHDILTGIERLQFADDVLAV